MCSIMHFCWKRHTELKIYIYENRHTALGGICCCLVAKSCLTLLGPMDCDLPGSSVRGISEARILEWVPFPSPGDLPNLGREPAFPLLAGEFSTAEPPRKPLSGVISSPKPSIQLKKNIRLTKWKGNLLKRRKYLQTLCHIRGYYPNYIKSSLTQWQNKI